VFRGLPIASGARGLGAQTAFNGPKMRSSFSRRDAEVIMSQPLRRSRSERLEGASRESWILLRDAACGCSSESGSSRAGRVFPSPLRGGMKGGGRKVGPLGNLWRELRLIPRRGGPNAHPVAPPPPLPLPARGRGKKRQTFMSQPLRMR
jgi:hypothetical protein